MPCLDAGRQVEDGDDLPAVVVDVELRLRGQPGRHGVDCGANRDCHDVRVEVRAELAGCLKARQQVLKGAPTIPSSWRPWSLRATTCFPSWQQDSAWRCVRSLWMSRTRIRLWRTTCDASPVGNSGTVPGSAPWPRAGQGCVLANPVFERIAHPSVTSDRPRATAMHYSDSRVQALAGALCQTVGAITGITNRSLRALMTGLLGTPYTMWPGLLRPGPARPQRADPRRPHANIYDLTPRRAEARHLLHPRSTIGS